MLIPTLALCPGGRFRALGTQGQGKLSDRERCGAILNQVLGAESPLCHLGATQVGVWREAGMAGKGEEHSRTSLGFRGPSGWCRNGAGLGWQVPWEPQKNRLSGSKRGCEAPGEEQGRPLPPGTHAWPASGPRLCPQVLLQELGWQWLERHWAQQCSQALLTLHRSLRACISHQRLRLLPRMQAQVRGLQARSAGVG